MRVEFLDDKLKKKLVDFAGDVDLSLNMLVNKILSAQFSDQERKSVQLLHELRELKQNIS
jgi:hypothetical protein